VNCEYPGLCLLHVIIHVVFVNLSLYIKYFMLKLSYIVLVCKGVVKGELWSNMALKGKVFGDLG
jgi:hypothetical protein